MIKVVNEIDGSSQLKASIIEIAKLLFMIVHILSIIGCIVGACVLYITDTIAVISCIVCVIFSILGKFVYD